MPAARANERISKETCEEICARLESGDSAHAIAAAFGIPHRIRVFQIYRKHRGVRFRQTPFTKTPLREGPPRVKEHFSAPVELISAAVAEPSDTLAAGILIRSVLDARQGQPDAIEFVASPHFEAVCEGLGWTPAKWRYYGHPLQSGPIGPLPIRGR